MLEIKMRKYSFLFLWSTVLALCMAKKSAETGCQARLATNFSSAYLDGTWSFGWKEFWEGLLASAWRFNVLSLRHPLKTKAAQDVETSVTTNSPSQDSFQPHDQIPSGYVSSWGQTLLKISVNNSVCMEQIFFFLCFISTKLWELGKLKPAKLSSSIWQRLSSYLLVDDLLSSLLTRECTMSDERVNRGWWAPIRLPVFPRWTGNKSTSNPKQHDQKLQIGWLSKGKSPIFAFLTFLHFCQIMSLLNIVEVTYNQLLHMDSNNNFDAKPYRSCDLHLFFCKLIHRFCWSLFSTLFLGLSEVKVRNKATLSSGLRWLNCP